MLKSAIRKEILQQRRELSEDEFLILNQLLLAQFKTIDFSGINSIHVFLPIVEKREPDTFLLIDWLQQNHSKMSIVVSRSNFSDHSMSHHPYQKEDLKANHYHIPEPQTTEIFEGRIDMVLVPLLAFDQHGYRVGYGKGFYDRFLSEINTRKVGISLFDILPEDISDVHKDDIKLDLCITPKQIYSFVN
ncbi:5-formyltetrahydrofolate cyclo-ligase [Pedobacter chitinilyticus]|uniref:5-formyltetrahydrofolate cyclo-ligase n=1 Tax=Pedobacter chitinilyticus TaxID=2233776 RepID=A0A3S3SUH3_9SPHI|nr:5-formyltetrahydrofolate cyclo-ligase [Pedobacter chitinilyticus]RWU07668.1 5-formyltetrahydrofolate cyclo-ligase [Pedobacter chitinilyticus]